MPDEFYAHTPPDDAPKNWHLLTHHTEEVAKKAAEFAESFHCADIARYLGLLHDLGKFTDAFQQYLRDCAAKIPRKPGSAPHKQMGALAAARQDAKFGLLWATAILGHHGGMVAAGETLRKSEDATSAGEVDTLLARQEAQGEKFAVKNRPDAPPDFALRGPNVAETEMLTRLLFSCLTDADALDTERHFRREDAERRDFAALQMPSLAALRNKLRDAMADKMASAKASDVNAVRRKVYESCLKAAQSGPGVFTLAVPTGGGKTLASLAFALEHAVNHNQRRVVYAIPYTSIVDQTADEFRKVLGDGAVLEHHSAIETRLKNDQDAESEMTRRLAAQNWDAPVVVTTTVQLFESLFSNRPARCRKLHRLVDSVIVLDEVQTLPPTLLAPILSALNVLTARFGVTVVLCTATQPALNASSEFLHGFSHVTPIVADADRDRHFAALRRVTFHFETHDENGWDWTRVAGEMRRGEPPPSCLCIVNTRRHALALLDALDPENSEVAVLHLSTLLCSRHRKNVLEIIRRRLREKRPVLLASTQVIEAGVDLDAPRVLRSLGPLDRIVQAAGRCNREGLRLAEDSEVVIFRPADDKTPPGVYKIAQQKTELWLMRGKLDSEKIHDPNVVTKWFEAIYSDLETDTKKVMPDIQHFRYPEVAEKMRLIDDETVSVFVSTYEPTEEENDPTALAEAQRLLKEIKARRTMTGDLWRRVQPFCISIFARDIGAQRTEEIAPGLLHWIGEDYHPKRGLPLPDDPADPVVYKNLQA